MCFSFYIIMKMIDCKMSKTCEARPLKTIARLLRIVRIYIIAHNIIMRSACDAKSRDIKGQVASRVELVCKLYYIASGTQSKNDHLQRAKMEYNCLLIALFVISLSSLSQAKSANLVLLSDAPTKSVSLRIYKHKSRLNDTF